MLLLESLSMFQRFAGGFRHVVDLLVIKITYMLVREMED